MATESREEQQQQQPQETLPPLLDHRVATTPPPSFPLLPSSDHFPFSEFDSYDWDRLDNQDTFFGDPSPYFDSFGLSSQLPRHPSVPSSAPSPTQRSRFSSPSLTPRPFSSRHSTRSPPVPILGSESIEAVDLTDSPGNMAPRRVTKRSAPSSAAETRTDKKRKRSSNATSAATQGSSRNGAATEDPEVDLREAEDGEVADILQKQMEDQIKSQQKEREAPPKLTAIQCIICLESPTDLTVTSCGHLFCHACLMPALNTGEPSKSRCPVCRRPVNRVKKSGKALDFQPLELKLKTKSGSSNGKGKGREAPGAGVRATAASGK